MLEMDKSWNQKRLPISLIFTKQIKAVATTMNNLVRLFQEKLLSKLTASNKLYKQVNHQKLEAKNQIRKDLSEL